MNSLPFSTVYWYCQPLVSLNQRFFRIINLSLVLKSKGRTVEFEFYENLLLTDVIPVRAKESCTSEFSLLSALISSMLHKKTNSMSKSKDSALKFFPSKNVRPLSGVLAARTVTIPPKQRNEFTLSSQAQNTKTETSSKAEQDVSDAALNDRLIEDSEFLLQATLFLQTAEEQLSSIESSLKRPMYPKNLLGLNLENCEDKKYAKEIVGAILSGHTLKRENFFSIPTRLKRQSVSDKPPEASKENSLKPESKLSSINRKKVRQSSENKVASSQKESHKFLRISGHRTTDKVSQTSSSTESNFPSQSTIPEHSRSEASEKSQLVDKPRKNKEYFISGEAKHEYPVPYQVTRKKMTIEDIPICVTTDLKTPNNAALINILSNTTEPEDDSPTKSKLAKNSLQIQAMPSINIKPALIQETFTQVDIQPCKSLQKEFAINKNVSFIEIVHDENSKIIRKGTPFSGNTYMDGLNRKPNLNAERLVTFRETNLEHIPRQECVPKQEPLSVKKHNVFRRERLDQILNTITDKLTAQIEIPDEILENTIDRLWVLGDYLEDMYTNSAGNFHQKVRLNFTSLWLHEIVRLIDIEMKRKPDSLNTGIPTIVQYIISEIQCKSAINYQQSCIIAEENDEIKFYCEHDSPLNLQYKHKLGNQSVSFRRSSRNSPQTNNRPLTNSLASKAKEHPESKKSHNFLLEDFQEPNKANSENVGANLIPQILSSSRSKLTSKTVHGLSSKRNLENCIEVRSQDHSVPEKLVTSKIKNTDGRETTSKNNLNFHEKNKFMNADQRQKVIQKLGAEVKKMLSWHEEMQPRKDINRLPNHSVSHNACIKASVTSSPKITPPVTIPPPILPSKDEIRNVESCNEVIGAETNFQEMVKGIDLKVASSLSASSKSTVIEQVKFL
ncbi:uncharacterized protein [Bemisia tabaci]|uniref:uncharacterized protein isoform X1 n=2 Tax=Bemisia tabaci TaxID=7038 RepID=UPI003B285D7C